MTDTHLTRLIGPLLLCLTLVACGDNNSNPRSSSQPPVVQPDTTSPDTAPPDTTTNQPPRISGSPSNQATVGQQWSFQPAISDPDGDNLNITASNLPGWLSLDTNSGRLRGTPTDADVQTWNGIRLSVSDGEATTSLPAFALTVVPQNSATGSVTLSWLPPTENTDGTPIVNLAGYRLLYGQVSQNYSSTIVITNPGITRYMIEGLSNGTWYFAIQTVTADGQVSDPSGEASKVI